jgi:hypothetical protein
VSTRRVGHFCPIASASGDCEDGEFGGMKIGRGNRSTRRKPAPAPLCKAVNFVVRSVNVVLGHNIPRIWSKSHDIFIKNFEIAGVHNNYWEG